LQGFLQETYGIAVWRKVAADSGAPKAGFEAMLTYDDALTEAVITAAEQQLDKPRAELLQDLGTFLVSHRSMQRLRRLLRFGGESFSEFLFSLEDLPGRARLAVPELEMPELQIHTVPGAGFEVKCFSGFADAGRVMQGVLAAMADDYGALVFLDFEDQKNGTQVVRVDLLDMSHTEGKSFSLAPLTGGIG